MFSFTGPKEKDHQENAFDFLMNAAATTRRRLPTEINAKNAKYELYNNILHVLEGSEDLKTLVRLVTYL